MKSRLKYIVYAYLIISIYSCGGREYEATKEYVKCSQKIDQGFSFLEITVDSFGLDSIPVSYSIVTQANVNSKTKNIALPKTVFFYKKSNKYDWFNSTTNKHSDTLPIKMNPNNWYLIRALMGDFGNPNKNIFIHVNEKGEYYYYYKTDVSNW